MWSDGFRQIVVPDGVSSVTLTLEIPSALIIDPLKGPAGVIVDDTYIALNTTIDPVTGSVYTFGWTATDEETFRSYAANLVQVLIWVLASADELPMENYTKTFYDTVGNPLITSTNFVDAYLFAFDFIRDYVNALPGISANAIAIVTALVDESLVPTFTTPQYTIQPSTITAVGHTWSSTLAGVALTRIPPAFNRTNIEASIIEQNDGQVIASGQDDQGSALFVGGMTINADTGELSGPPFDSAVGRIATKSAIAFGNF